MTGEDIQSEADAQLIELVGADDVASVLPGLRAWLDAAPAHRVAFARSARVWRLAGPLLRAGEPGAGQRELNALLQALELERWA